MNLRLWIANIICGVGIAYTVTWSGTFDIKCTWRPRSNSVLGNVLRARDSLFNSYCASISLRISR